MNEYTKYPLTKLSAMLEEAIIDGQTELASELNEAIKVRKVEEQLFGHALGVWLSPTKKRRNRRNAK